MSTRLVISKLYDKALVPLLLAALLAVVAYWGQRVDANVTALTVRVGKLETWRAKAMTSCYTRDLATVDWLAHQVDHARGDRRLEVKHDELVAELHKIGKSLAALETAANIRGLFAPQGGKAGNE